MYPYTAGSTTGDAIFPPEMRAGGRAEFLAGLVDPALRAKMIAKMRFELDELGQFRPLLRRAAGHPDRRRQAGNRRRLARQAARRRRARRRRRQSRQRRGVRRRVRFLRRQCRRDRHHQPLRQRSDDGALLPPADDGDLHRRADARSGTEAASALARRRSPRRCAWGARWAFRSNRWCGGWRRCPAASSISPIRRCKVGADASLTLFDPATVGERNDYLDPSIRAGRHRHGVDPRRSACSTTARCHRRARSPGGR